MLARGEDLDELPGIGRDLADKIGVIAHGEHLPMLDELEDQVSPGITALLALPGLGPKRVHLRHEKLGIDTICSAVANLVRVTVLAPWEIARSRGGRAEDDALHHPVAQRPSGGSMCGT